MGVLLLLTASCSTADLIQPEAITVNRANNYYARGRFSQSVELYRKAVDENPDSPYRKTALLGLADSVYKNGDFFEAVMYYERFLEQFPLDRNTARAQFYLAMCYYQDSFSADRDQTNSKKAIKEFERFEQKYPGHPLVQYAVKFRKEMETVLVRSEMEVALYYYRVEKNISAITRLREYYEKHPESDDAPEALFLLADCYMREQSYKRAATIFTFLIKTFPESQFAGRAKERAKGLKLKKTL